MMTPEIGGRGNEGADLRCYRNGRPRRVARVSPRLRSRARRHLGRTATGIRDGKLREIVHNDLLNYAGMEESLTGFDACFFCLGIASAGMKKSDYECVTYGYTIAAAEILSRLNPGMTFIFISDSGTDSTGKGRIISPCQSRTENAQHVL